MEQKKTLWIIAAVGIFLLTVLGVAWGIVRSSADYTSYKVEKPATERHVKGKKGWENSNNPNPPEFTKDNHEFKRPEFNNSKVNEMFVVSENTTVYDTRKTEDKNAAQNQSTTIDLNSLKRELSAELAAQTQNPQNINITVTMPERENTAPVVITSDYYTGKESETPAKKETVTAVTKKEEVSPAPKAKETPKSTPTKVEKTAPVKTTVSTPKTVTRYWVQVAAYTNKKTAENARAILSDNKISSDIFTYQDNKNKLFYRVRVGPYTTKSEAEYWQAKIIKIDDFKSAQAYVTSTTD